MCQFFSCISDGKGKVYYLNAEIRKRLLADSIYAGTDTHSAIAAYFFPATNGGQEDNMNKYEYSPLTNEFRIDQLNTIDDSEKVKTFCEKLDFKTVVPELVVKSIIHPLKDINGVISERAIELLKEWANMWDGAGACVGSSIWASVGDSVGASVWASVRVNTGKDILTSIENGQECSIRTTIWTYCSSFFKLMHWHKFEHLPKCQNPFQSAIDLWEMGLVPSFDGAIWRLHAKSGVVYKATF